MQFFTTILAAAAVFASSSIAAPTEAPALEAREVHARDVLEIRDTLVKRLVCQLGGLFPGGGNAACTAECVAKGRTHGGHCNQQEYVSTVPH